MSDVEKYINSYSGDIKEKMLKIRGAVLELAPGAVESMSYGLVGYKLNKKPLIYFGAFKTHIGFYATPSGHVEFEADLSKYKKGKGSVQFPLVVPLPMELIKRMIRFRVKENNEK